MKRPPIATEKAAALVRDLPGTPHKTLARRLVREFPEIFHNVEQARSAIRYVTGNHGEALRRNARRTHGEDFRPPTPAGSAWLDMIPAGEKTLDWTPYHLAGRKILAIADIHAPYHDDNAIAATLSYGQQIGIDAILINGDLVDFHAISFWETDPDKRDTIKELQTTWQLLKAIRKGFPGIPIYLKGGNHDDRLGRYIAQRAPELFRLKISDWFYTLTHPELYGLDGEPDLKLTRIGSLKPIKVGSRLWILHGHEFGKAQVFNPVNAARGTFLRAYECCLTAHNHQTSEHTTRTLSDRLIATWSMGCLCDLHPKYGPINWRWNHGFSVIHSSGPEWRLENRKIIKGKVY